MTFAHILLYFTVLSQTKIDATTQVKGTTLVPNSYFITAMNQQTGKVQILPGIEWSRLMKIEPVVPPPSGAVCGKPLDGSTRPAYEFGRAGSVILSDDYLYICATDKKWKRFRLESY